MARKSKSNRKASVPLSSLIRAEEAAEEEILETPALSSLGTVVHAAHDPNHDDDDDDDDEEAAQNEEAEAEIERRLVQEAQAEAQAVKAAAAAAEAIYKKDAMEALVQDWYSPQLRWDETLDVCTAPLELETVHDDLKREVAFYNQTLQSVKFAKAKMLQLQLPYKRPVDYFAEMLKSDSHMAKIKDKLIYEQKKITAVEERKQSQAHRRVAKELQAEKLKQRSQAKKETLDAVKQWKKRRQQGSGGAGGAHDDDGDQALHSMLDKPGNKPLAGSKRKRDTGPSKPNKRREQKNQKFGFGGPKRVAKRNSKESTNDFRSFSAQRNKSGHGATKSGKAKAGKSTKRPGKAARQNRRK